MRILYATASLCPICKKRIEGAYVETDGKVHLKKICPEHGAFQTRVWEGEGFTEWCNNWRPETEDSPWCPEECGVCENHKNQTCCAILDITTQCNLRCPICFADSGRGEHMPTDKVYRCLDDMYDKGLRFIHISGGEPTIHPDFFDIVSYAKKKGFLYIQINTNGVRLAEDASFAKDLEEAGASCVFLQFDGTTEEAFEKIRGGRFLEIKKKAIENCDRAELGVVLVPTVIPGINDGQIGSIIRFALDHAPAVRGIHFQPITYMGRYFEGEHCTLPEMMNAMEKQTDGLIRREQILPSACDAPLCGFHVEFKRKGDHLETLQDAEGGCCCGSSGSENGISNLVKNQFHVKNRWSRVKGGEYASGSLMAQKKEMSDASFCISGMMFQDLSNIDLGRVMHCSVHVYKEGKLIPFCVYHNTRSQV
ncbi:predicted Fe-S oxidoreductase [Clostridium sp. SY8519]|uniref:radical SAM protein n=1 Tax=Clostridium sp. (strain SY8519) TaxID=1042156 RepID=UPI0002171B9F|nr:radical SAM protein [Clostridium sp. SY8519]BAK46446.1 predicted Fe-S oxidoreductase [Clostridium sp. SY8519]